MNETQELVVKTEEVKPMGTSELARQHTAVIEWKPVEWTQQRTELARKTYAATASPEEFDFFIEWCKQTGLNPFLKQAWLVPRRAKMPNGSWAEKHEPMAAEAGMAARADSMPDFRGMQSGAVFDGDQFGVDEVTGEVVHIWDPATRAKKGNKLLGAWAKGYRNGRVTEVTYLTLESRKNDSPFWNTVDKATQQLKKCARADQYRRLYPALFNGVYIEGEYGNEIDITPMDVQLPRTPNAKTESLKEKIAARAIAATGSTPKSTVPPIDCLRFGPLKGKKIEECTSLELDEALAIADEALKKAKGDEPWLANVREGVDAVQFALDERNAAGVEPGSQG